MKAQPLTKFSSLEPEWVVSNGKRWQESRSVLLEGNQNRFRSRTEPVGAHLQDAGLRVSFPLSLGMGLGIGGGLNSTSLALRIVHIKLGSDVSIRAEDSTWGEDIVRYKIASPVL